MIINFIVRFYNNLIKIDDDKFDNVMSKRGSLSLRRVIFHDAAIRSG